ncbi:MAG: hypothetical protein RL518_1621 [Pseudomonadota bacterium]|jgi:hypothetical protein
MVTETSVGIDYHGPRVQVCAMSLSSENSPSLLLSGPSQYDFKTYTS